MDLFVEAGVLAGVLAELKLIERKLIIFFHGSCVVFAHRETKVDQTLNFFRLRPACAATNRTKMFRILIKAAREWLQ